MSLLNFSPLDFGEAIFFTHIFFSLGLSAVSQCAIFSFP